MVSAKRLRLTLIIPGISLYGFNSFKADLTRCFDSKLKYRSKSISTGADSIDGMIAGYFVDSSTITWVLNDL
jgi:hypothetical protein